MSNELTLTEVETGLVAIIDCVECSDKQIAARLSHLGFLPGTQIKVVRRAPLGDPTVFEFRGNQMSLRKSESCSIKVHLAATA